MSENHVLTDRRLKKLAVGEHADGKISGLVFRVRDTGGRSWAYRYRVNGRLRRLTLGAYPALGLAAARVAARAARKKIALGRDPAAEKRQAREAGTFGELAERYIEKWAKPRKRTWQGDVRMLDKHVLPRWKHIPAAEIERRDARVLLERVAEAGPVAANRVRSLLSKIFNYAITTDAVTTNPIVGIERNPESTRDRVLSEEELRAFWAATEPDVGDEADDDDAKGMTAAMSARYRLQLATAQRGGEVSAMRWADVDLDSSIWTIPAEQAKNGLAHRVPLAHLAVEIIESLPRKSQYVLAGARGMRQQREAKSEIPVSDFRPHDLRRTAASYMASMGIPRTVIAKVLNHVETGVTAVYDRHGYDNEKRDALNRWALELERIVTDKRGEVVPIR